MSEGMSEGMNECGDKSRPLVPGGQWHLLSLILLDGLHLTNTGVIG